MTCIEEGSGIYCHNCGKEVPEDEVLMVDFGVIYDMCSDDCIMEFSADRFASMVDDAYERQRDSNIA